MKNDHPSLVNERTTIPLIESPKFELSKYSNWMDFVSCEVCPSLHEDIKSLKIKLEQHSKAPMIFAMKSKCERTPFRRPYKNIYHIRYVPAVKSCGHTTSHPSVHRVQPNVKCPFHPMWKTFYVQVIGVKKRVILELEAILLKLKGDF